METFLFAVYALVACGGALAVLFSQNVVRMAFWLVISLGSVAGLFFMLDAGFVAATQLLIYVGGTVVLLIFGVMLTASGPFLAIRANPGDLVQAGLVALAFLGLVGGAVLSVDWRENSAQLAEISPPNDVNAPGYLPSSQGGTVHDIGFALLGIRGKSGGEAGSDELAAEAAHAAAHARGLPHSHEGTVEASATPQPGYLLPFEIISVHLLVVLIGAAYLARAKRRAATGTAREDS